MLKDDIISTQKGCNMANYESILKQFFKYCEREQDAKKQGALFRKVFEVLPEKYWATFAIDVFKSEPKAVDINYVNASVLESFSVKNSVKLVEAGLCSDSDMLKHILNISYLGDDKACFSTLKSMASKKINKDYFDYSLSKTEVYEYARALSVMSTKVVAGKNTEYNYELAEIRPKNYIKNFINRDKHIEVVIKNGEGEYLSKLISECNTINKIPAKYVDQIVELLCQRKYSCADKYDAMMFIKNCEGDQRENYSKLYNSILDKNNPLYLLKLSANSKAQYNEVVERFQVNNDNESEKSR